MSEPSADAATAKDPHQRRGEVHWLLIGAAVLWLGPWFAPPGVNVDTLANGTSTDLLGMFNISRPFLGVLGPSLPTLVLLDLTLVALGLKQKPLARRLAFGLYLTVSAVQAWVLSISLVGLNDLSQSVVPEPGLRFQLFFILALSAGASILWWVAGQIDRTRWAHGSLFLLLMSTIVGHIAFQFDLGLMIAAEEIEPFAALAHLVLPLCLAWIATLMVIKPPAAWPVTIYALPKRLRRRANDKAVGSSGATLFSPWDAFALVCLGAIRLQVFNAAAVRSMHPLQLDSFVAFFVTLGFSLWWFMRPGRTGVPSRPSRWALGLPVALFALMIPVFFLGLRSETVHDAEQPVLAQPLVGENVFILTLRAEDEDFAPTDADALAYRLSSLGASVAIEARTARRVRLRIGASDLDGVRLALRPGRIGFHMVGPTPELFELPVGVDRLTLSLSTGEERVVLQGECDALERFRSSRRDLGCLWLMEELDSECQLGCFDPRSVIQPDDIESAVANRDSITLEPQVALTLTEAGGRRMGETTRRNLNRPMAIVVDGSVVSVPRIASEIGAHVSISSLGPDLREAEREAQVLASALAPAGRVQASFAIQEELTIGQ